MVSFINFPFYTKGVYLSHSVQLQWLESKTLLMRFISDLLKKIDYAIVVIAPVLWCTVKEFTEKFRQYINSLALALSLIFA